MRLRDLIELVRAPAALSVPGDVVAGAAAARVLSPRTPALAGASVCLYWAGMAANDWADRNVDAVERPERPIPSGRVSPPVALGVAVGLTAAGVAGAGLVGGRRALAAAGTLAGAVWAYDLGGKDTAAGPALMAACRGLDVLLGASAGPVRRAVPAALTVAAHTYTVTALSRHEVHGGNSRVPAATLAATGAVALAAAISPRDLRRSDASSRSDASRRDARRSGVRAGLGVLLAGWYAAQYGRTQARAAADPGAARMRAAVAAGIIGLPVLQGALVARAGNVAGALAVAAAAPLGRRLARKVSPT
jgi:4-hydroxybenzoate polyprenyltransferase